MLGRKGWKTKEREVEIALETASGVEAMIGQLLLERLRTYGEFYDRLANERDVDLEIARRQAAPDEPEVAASFASCTLGGLTLTARNSGAGGNAITATVSPGTAAQFSVQGIGENESQALLTSTVSALYGAAPPLSSNPDIAAAQQAAADFLANLDDATRRNAEALVRNNWDRYRVARTTTDAEYDRDRALAPLDQNLSQVAPQTNEAFAGMVAQAPADQAALMNAHLSQPVVGAFDGKLSDLTAGDYDAASIAEHGEVLTLTQTVNDAYSAMVEQQRATIASVFNLTLAGFGATEVYNDIFPGQSISFEKSDLVSIGFWNGADRPVDGETPFTGGVNGSPARGGLFGVKPDEQYTITVDTVRTFNLIQIEDIVIDTVAAADRWLVQ